MAYKMRFGAMNGRQLVHTSFWLDPWTRNAIRTIAKNGMVSQSLLLNALVLDYWLKTLPAEKITTPDYVKCKRFVHTVFTKIR